MSDTFSKVEVITGVARRRRFSADHKLAVVAETMQPGKSVWLEPSVRSKRSVKLHRALTVRTLAARRHKRGFLPELCCRFGHWPRQSSLACHRVLSSAIRADRALTWVIFGCEEYDHECNRNGRSFVLARP